MMSHLKPARNGLLQPTAVGESKVLAKRENNGLEPDATKDDLFFSQARPSSRWPRPVDFFLRANLVPSGSLLEKIREFAEARLKNIGSPAMTLEAAPFQGYCSYTLLADADKILQFRPERHRLPVDIARDAEKIFGFGGREMGAEDEAAREGGQQGYDSGYSDGGEQGTTDVQLPGCENSNSSSARRKPRSCLADHQHRSHSLPRISVPHTQNLGLLEGLETLNKLAGGHLHAYLLTFVPGQSLASLQRNRPTTLTERRSLLRDFASHFALSFYHSREPDDPWLLHRRAAGKISSSLDSRVSLLLGDLPPKFRPLVQKVLDSLESIKQLPWALTHGDLVPDNIHLDERGRLCGLVDWAEGEWLPLGVGMYGVEYLLGEFRYDEDKGFKRFGYCEDAAELRGYFWDEFCQRSGLRCRSGGAARTIMRSAEMRRGPADGGLLETIKLASILGLLLWNGVAFDDGRLDRVVDERDEEEYARLMTLLSSVEI